MKRITCELAEIQAFVAVAERLNFKAAADSIFLSQPALSRRIDKLESAVGGRLFERTTRRVALTDAGVRFLEHARAAIGELETGIRGIAESATRHSGQVTVACVPSVANYLLPRVLKEFAESHSATRLRVIDEGAQAVLASVVSGAADFGLNFIGTQEPDIEFRPIRTEKYVLAVRTGHRLAGRASVAWEELADETFISVAMSSGNRMLMDHALARLKRRPVVTHEASHVAGVLGMVEAGLGIAAVPDLALAEGTYPSIIRIALGKPVITRTLGLIARKGRHLPPAAAALYALLQQRPRR